MTDHVKTLEQAKDRPELNEGGTIMAEVGGAIRAVLEENERLRKEWDRLKDEARVLRSDRDAVTFERNKAEKERDRLKEREDELQRLLTQDHGGCVQRWERAEKERDRLEATLQANPHHRECLKTLDEKAEENKRQGKRLAALGSAHHTDTHGYCSCGKLSCDIRDVLEEP